MESENKDTLEPVQKVVGKKIVCPKCGATPSVKILPDKVTKISVKCTCEYKDNLFIDDFNENLLKPIEKSVFYCNLDETHPKEEAVNYCESCKLFMCAKCVKMHSKIAPTHTLKAAEEMEKNKKEKEPKSTNKQQEKFKYFCIECNKHFPENCILSTHVNHQLIDLENLAKSINIQRLKEQIKNLQSYIKVNLTSIKEILIRNLENIITLLNKSYDNFMKIDEKIINLMLYISEGLNLEYPNYFQIMNILEINRFQFTYFSSNSQSDNTNKFLGYLNNAANCMLFKNDHIEQLLSDYNVNNPFNQMSKVDQDEQRDGWEVRDYKDNEQYQGQLKNDKKHGYGIYLYSDGRRYKGEWKCDKKQGYGTIIYMSGTKYSGYWKNGVPNGYGVDYYSNGDTYEGEYKDGKKSGIGVYFYNGKGDRYDGEFRDGEKNGHAIITYSNGNKYDGEFKKDKKQGYGIVFYSNGDRFEGEFKNDKKNGLGTNYFANGKVEKVQYKLGELVKDEDSSNDKKEEQPKSEETEKKE